jgi:hypothetical protein
VVKQAAGGLTTILHLASRVECRLRATCVSGEAFPCRAPQKPKRPKKVRAKLPRRWNPR